MESLFDPAEESAPVAPPRASSKAIAPGDVVAIDKRGRRFHAHVVALHQRASGRFELELAPIESGITYRTASVREVVTLWRATARGPAAAPAA